MERERAIGMLQAKVKPLVIAQRFRCHARAIECLRNCFWQICPTSDRARSGRHCVMTRRQDRFNRITCPLNEFRCVTATARTTPGTHNPRISAQTMADRLQEIGVRHLYVREFICAISFFA